VVSGTVVRLDVQSQGRSLIPYAIVIAQISGELRQHDSIPAGALIQDVAERTFSAARSDGVATVEVQTPGYHIWRARALRLPTTMHGVLEGQNNPR
jgi:hypothetical protein